jgi:hypothetical protein
MDARVVPGEVVRGWVDLEGRALEPNAYLSPHFVLPALRHLTPETPARVFTVEAPRERADEPPRMLGVLVGEPVVGTRGFPLPHIRGYQSCHSFLTGMLLDRERAPEALDAVLGHFAPWRSRWQGLEFDSLWGDGPTHDLLVEVGGRRRMVHQEWNECKRAVLLPRADRARIEAVETAESHALRRRVRRLCERGKTAWRLVCRGGVPDSSTEAFLNLEHQGWKRERGTSLRSSPAHERFFREMVRGFSRENRAFFVQLHLDGEIVASSSNFVSGRSGFAFKVGWQPDLAKVSPGRLAELELMRQLYQHDDLSKLDFLDSGATEGSYIDALWPGRRSVVSFALGASTLGRVVLGGIGAARLIRRSYRAHVAASGPEDACDEPAKKPLRRADA